LPAESFCRVSGEVGDRLFPNDADMALRSFEKLILRRDDPPSSLFLSLADRFRLQFMKQQSVTPLAAAYPRGLQELFKIQFVLDEVVDGLTGVLAETPQPFLAYFHLLPPHEPYHPHRDFIDRFRDGWRAEPKEARFFSDDVSEAELNRFRQQYDEFLAYTDHTFNRMLRFLEENGYLDNSIVVVTSDHGQLFERGIHGHVTRALYEPLLRVPLLISLPGQSERRDVTAPTSCVDLLPTLLHLTGQAIPEWCEGRILPLNGERVDSERPIFALEAKSNHKERPFTMATFAMVKGDYKLLRYLGYERYGEQYELFNIAADPEERVDLMASQAATAAELKQELLANIARVDSQFM
jgi:arylsulfatase A-like enzyme